MRIARGVIIGAFALLSSPCVAETMSGALSRAYVGNPDLNQQRAYVRATDEDLPRVSSQWRPSASASGQAGYNYLDSISGDAALRQRESSIPRSVGLTVTQNLFNGGRTLNGVRQAESNIFGARESLRNTELNVLQNGATAYMNVLRDTAIVELRKNNITVLEEQLRQTRDRFNVGEVTRTDVAQAQASLANSRSDYFTAQANLQNSVANFRQIIGIQPGRLEPARTIENLLPRSLDSAVVVGLSEHPAIQAALHAVDAAALQVKVVEGELYPTVGITANVQQNWAYAGFAKQQLFNTSLIGQITVPIYTGGEVDARARQAKETLGQARLQADLQRDFIRASVVSAWGVLDSARAVIQSSRAAVKAAEIALEGIREEAKVGQRTTFDVLFAQQTLLNTRVSLVTAQRDRVVASYAVMAAIGRLSAANLSLNVAQYDPTIHFDQVKDKWIGLRTPDGR
ncbi:TolC family outer membrane protein [Methylocapsa aurea]|uniref:TolC family outer membrane protein n=1 Tax=Methylocapsa aurea TaxID=663610 RepID=UPI0009FBA802|nr:TolC family outer membrane protein [Methylocapsa aurea]